MASSPSAARFGAIRWESDAGLDDAIRMVRACHDANDAVQLASGACGDGERWAVVDLRTMRVLASGPATRRRPPH